MRSLEASLIRPPRAIPRSSADLGPVHCAGLTREEVALTNERGQELAVSFYRPPEERPCVLYAHGNASNRCEGLQLRSWAVSMGCSLCAFDFAGCGESGGGYITLGQHERDDLRVVLDWLLTQREVSAVVIVGRSMGAVATLLLSSDADCEMTYLGKLKVRWCACCWFFFGN